MMHMQSVPSINDKMYTNKLPISSRMQIKTVTNHVVKKMAHCCP